MTPARTALLILAVASAITTGRICGAPRLAAIGWLPNVRRSLGPSRRDPLQRKGSLARPGELESPTF